MQIWDIADSRTSSRTPEVYASLNHDELIGIYSGITIHVYSRTDIELTYSAPYPVRKHFLLVVVHKAAS